MSSYIIMNENTDLVFEEAVRLFEYCNSRCGCRYCVSRKECIEYFDTYVVNTYVKSERGGRNYIKRIRRKVFYFICRNFSEGVDIRLLTSEEECHILYRTRHLVSK